MNTPLIEIFVLCYNRTSVIKTISSILNQSSPYYRLVVSNNSTNPVVYQKIKEFFPDVEVRNRGGLSARDHFLLCMNEARLDYFCLFHDDDEMAANFVEAVTDAIDENPGAQAFGTNAVVSLDGVKLGESFRSSDHYKLIHDKYDLAAQYFGKRNEGIAPYPSYVYKTAGFETSGIKRIRIKDYGKYADFLIIMSQLESGPIFWINKPLMTYNLHDGNDGGVESLKDRLRLLSALKIEFKECERILNQYRLLMYTNAAKTKNGKYKKIEKRLRLRRRFGFFCDYVKS